MRDEPELFAVRLQDEPIHGGAGTPQRSQVPRKNGDTEELNRHLIRLITGIGAEDRQAFTEFYRATSHRTYGLAMRILQNRASAEEVTQEVYLQVWSMASRFDSDLGSAVGWLLMLTHRRAVDRSRAERSAESRDRVYGQNYVGRDHDVVAEEVGQRLDEESVNECLATLTAIQQEAIALAYYGGLTYREVAEELNVPLPTVKTRIRDGLKRLETCLTGSEPHGD